MPMLMIAANHLIHSSDPNVNLEKPSVELFDKFQMWYAYQ